MTGTEASPIPRSGPDAGKGAEKTGFLANLDRQLIRHQSAISAFTGVLAVLGLAAMFLGIARVAPSLKVLSPF